MRLFLPFLLLGLVASLSAAAQLVTFSKLPQSYQLYPRNAQSVASVPVAGRVMQTGYSRVAVQVYRNNTWQGRQMQTLTYAGGTAPFSFSATIPAELAQYRVQVYLYGANATDSVLVADRQHIVAGDVFIIGGQSNASAYVPAEEYSYQNEYIRTLGVYGENFNLGNYNPADTLWTTCGLTRSTSAGVWGMEMARRIVEQYQIPVCVLNAAAGGAGIEYLSVRNAGDPMDLNTNHGRLLYRVHKGGLQGGIKAYFFRQGENETSGNAPIWPSKFEELYSNVQLDLPGISRFYLFQIHLLGGFNAATAVFRDYQRRVGNMHAPIRTHATVGTIGYDGIHFSAAGYAQTGAEVFRLVARDFYGSTDTDQITSPNVQKIYYTNAAQSELAIQFEEGQQMVWPADTTVQDYYGNPLTHGLRDWLWLDQQAGRVVAGRAVGNQLILTLDGSRSEQKLAYLPPNYGNGQPQPGLARAFPGPFIRNRRGLRAFSFWEVPIAAPLSPLTGLVASVVSGTAVQLTWTDHPAEQAYILERKRPFDSTFLTVAQVPANTTSFTDLSTNYNVTYQYRLRAVTPQAEATAEASATIACPSVGELVSVKTGGFSEAATWNCGRVPTVADRVRISAGHRVEVGQLVTVGRLTVAGTLQFGAGGQIRIAP
ncbi:sialate O-acetylesterase [Rudanella lutea]|uniref:sialate O-acetylesterase n=1 Tax=Rudanella lutea TaxID=451374 RepID=UPI000377749C|nr:fibronectin type III domain-containing protein [Rudanella lutea]